MRQLRPVVRMMLVLGVLCLASGCGPHDTGVIGTWERELQGATSRLIIWQDGPDVRFRWNFIAPDGTHIVSCEAGEVCLEKDGEEIKYEYEFEVSRQEGSEDHFVTCHGQPTDPDNLTIDYVDRLEVVRKGLVLHSWRVEIGGKPSSFSKPFVFKKVSD
jgi:hypothetical protein